MAFNVNLFQGALKFGGARPTLFQVNITNPVNGVGDIQVPFMVRAAQIPQATVGNIPVPYFGRTINVAGDRTYEPWTVTVINDEDFIIRNALEEWNHAINSPQGNLRALGSASPSLYKTSAQITQFSKTGVPLRVYDFVGMYPTDVAAMDVDWGTNDTIQEFQVTFQYDYWQISGGVTGSAGT